MSQPCVKQSNVEQPGEIDPDLDEFWVENPYDIFRQNNLSSFERNRAYINVRGKGFLEVSHLSGADDDGDSRAVLALDVFEPGKLDLVLRQVGGGPFKIYRNQFPSANYLKVSLEGIESNRLGYGSKITAHVGDQKYFREHFPINSYQSQQPGWAHFGLGKSDQIDKLEIVWPTGKTQVFENVKANQHLLVEEGSSTLHKYDQYVPKPRPKN